MAFTGVHIERPEAGAEIDNGWLFWLSWGASMIQILVFLLYIAVYGNYEERQQSQNFVQLSLVASTFIISLTYTNISLASSELESRSYWVLFTFVLLWLYCIVNLLQYLGKHFKVQRPG
jgi:tellurite resistance protein TehA-like permease